MCINTNCPLEPWVVEVRSALDHVFGKTEYSGVTDLWCCFEHLIGPQDSKKIRLTTKGWPQQIPDWMQCCSDLDTPPPLGRVPMFGPLWKTWWKKMQPDWCFGDGDSGKIELRQEEWPALMKGSSNSILLLLLSLSWWLDATKTEVDKNDCLLAVKDMHWVLEQMVLKLQAQKEEGEGEKENGEDREHYRKRYVYQSFLVPASLLKHSQPCTGSELKGSVV